MKKLCIALMMGLSLVVLDASAATKTCDKDGQYVKGAGCHTRKVDVVGLLCSSHPSALLWDLDAL